MSDERDPFPPPDAEEERAAAALRQALEGRPGGPELPEAALEAAALVRFGSDAGRLAPERRADLRAQLLAALPEPRRAERRGWRLWLGFGLPLVGAAAAVGLLFPRSERSEPLAASSTESRIERAPGAAPAQAKPLAAAGQAAADEAPRERAAARAKGGAGVPSPQFEQESRAYRVRLLPKVSDPRIHGVYAQVDRAQSRTELELAQAELRGLLAVQPGAGPALGSAADDAELLRQDIFCRLAEVALRLGQAQAALDWARRGLALDAEPNPFLARLFALEGQAKNALGDPDGAAKSFMQALEVHERLLDTDLDGP